MSASKQTVFLVRSTFPIEAFIFEMFDDFRQHPVKTSRKFAAQIRDSTVSCRICTAWCGKELVNTSISSYLICSWSCKTGFEPHPLKFILRSLRRRRLERVWHRDAVVHVRDDRRQRHQPDVGHQRQPDRLRINPQVGPDFKTCWYDAYCDAKRDAKCDAKS